MLVSEHSFRTVCFGTTWGDRLGVLNAQHADLNIGIVDAWTSFCGLSKKIIHAGPTLLREGICCTLNDMQHHDSPA